MIKIDEKTLTGVLWAAIPIAASIGYGASDVLKSMTGKDVVDRGSYYTRIDVEKDYIPKKEVENYYILKSEISTRYVSIDEYKKLEFDRNSLSAKLEEISKAPNSDTKTLGVGETWNNENPKFAIRLNRLYDYNERGVYAEIATSFIDAQPAIEVLDNFGESRDWTFRYKGNKYQITALLKKKGGKAFLDIEWHQI